MYFFKTAVFCFTYLCFTTLLISQNSNKENIDITINLSAPTTCNSSSPIVTGTGIVLSDYSDTDANGWRHFCDCDGNLLLSLDLSSAPSVIIPDVGGVKIKLGSPEATYYNGNTGFITNIYGASMLNRRWEVLPTTQPATGEEVNVRFYFTQMEFMALSDELANIDGLWELSDPSEMDFFKVTNNSLGEFPLIPDINTSDVIIIVNDYNNPTTSTWHNGLHGGFDHYAEYKVTSFSGGGGGAAGGGAAEILPVELSSFDGRLIEENTIKLSWETVSEKNNEGFWIERSSDGTNWEEIGFEQGKGNSSSISRYTFKDENPFLGNNYYRLHQMDYDGGGSYSDIIRIENIKKHTLQIYPNIVIQGKPIILDASLDNHQNSFLNVIDLNGHIHYASTMDLQSGENKIQIPTDNLHSGWYYMKINVNGKPHTFKLMVR